jgi:hypothetical protein
MKEGQIPAFILAFTAILILSAVTVRGAEPPPPDPGDVHNEWLILIYIAGDNDLGEDGEYGNAALMDIEEMEMSIPEEGVRVLALTDLKGPSSSYLYDIRPDYNEGVNSPTIPLSSVEPSWTDELDTGDPETVRSFIEYALGGNSFDRSMFVMWDHGSGWYMDGDVSRPPHTRGFAQDQNSGSIMFLDDLRDAFIDAEANIGDFEFDIIGHDTCYMGMMEVFYQLAPWSRIATGSMDEQPWYGYNYTFISSLEGAGPHEAADLASEMVDLFSAEYAQSSDRYHTIVAADVEVLENEFVHIWDMLARSLYYRMYHLEEEENGLFTSVRGRAETIGIDSIDVGSLLSELIAKDLESNITDLARSAKGVYDRMVLDSWIKPDGRNPKGTGLTVYLPGRQMPYKSIYDGSTGFLNLTADTFWDEAIREYQDPEERLRVNLTVVEGPSGSDYDLLISVEDVRGGSTVSLQGADIIINGTMAGQTNSSGQFLQGGISPGLYHVEARYGQLFDRETIKALNREPIPVITDENDIAGEGRELTFSALNSRDPDQDLLTFRWDLDDSDGLDDVDSTQHTVKVEFPDEGNRTIRLTVNDSGVSAHIDHVVEVVNLPPSAILDTDLVYPFEVYEDREFSLNGSLSTDVEADLEELEYRFLLDGSVIGEWSAEAEVGLSISDSGEHQILLEVRDLDGGTGIDSINITVLEKEPVAVLSGPRNLFEDQTGRYFGNGSFDTPSDQEILTYAWFVDGEVMEGSNGRVLDISFSDSGTHSLVLVVTDDSGQSSPNGTGRKEILINVMNRPPTAVVEGPSSVPVLESVTLSGTGSMDTPSDLPLLDFAWDTDGDGEIDENGSTLTFTPQLEGNLSVMLQVTDDDGDRSTLFHYVLVENIPPEPFFVIPQEVREDEMVEVEIEGSWDSPGDLDELEITWKLDDLIIGDGRNPPDFSIPLSGIHIVEVSARDDQGEVGTYTTDIEVVNPVPSVELSGVPLRVEVGESFRALGYRSTDNPSDMPYLTFEWFVNGELREDLRGKNATFNFDSPGKRIIALRVTDDDGDSYTVDLKVEVEEKDMVSRFASAIMSTTSLLIILIVLALILILLFRVRNTMKELRSPEVKETEEEEPTENPAGEKPAWGNSGTVLDNITEKNSGKGPGKVIPPPDLRKPAIPRGPKPGKAEVPPFDRELLK